MQYFLALIVIIGVLVVEAAFLCGVGFILMLITSALFGVLIPFWHIAIALFVIRLVIKFVI